MRLDHWTKTLHHHVYRKNQRIPERFTTHFKKLCNIAKFPKMTHNIIYIFIYIFIIVCRFGEFCNVTQLFEMSCVTLGSPLIFCDKRDGEMFLSFDQAAWAQSRALVLMSRD